MSTHVMISINYYNFHSNLRAWVFNERPHNEKLISPSISRPIRGCQKSGNENGETAARDNNSLTKTILIDLLYERCVVDIFSE